MFLVFLAAEKLKNGLSGNRVFGVFKKPEKYDSRSSGRGTG